MKRIGTKLILRVMLAIGVIVAGFSLVEMHFRQKEISTALEANAERTMELLELSLRDPLWNLSRQQMRLILMAHLKDPDILSIRLFEDGRILMFLGKAPGSSGIIDFKVEPSRLPSFERALVRRAEIVAYAEQIGAFEVVFSRQSVDTQLKKAFLNSALFFVLLGTALIASISSVMSRLVSRPVSQLNSVFQAVAEGDFDRDIDTTRLDEIGSLARSFAVLRDDIREKIVSLRESERKYRMLIENLPQKIFYKNFQSVYVACNENFARAFSLTSEDIVGKTDFDLFPEKLAEKYRADDRRIIETKGTEEIVERYVERGEEFIVQTVKTATRDEKGDSSGVLGIFWDITRQKKAEEEMSRLRNLLDNIVNSMPSILVGVSPQGTIEQWNRGAERLTGKPAEEVLGEQLDAALPEFKRETGYVQLAIRRRTPQKYEKVLKQKSGEQRFFDMMIYPLINEGQVEGAVLRIDDVTDRVQLEEMMIHAEKMVTVGGLAAGMAHEINNPLGVILQGVQSIRRRISPKLESNRQAAKEYGIELDALRHYLEQRHILHYLKGMEEAGIRAAQIVENMLHFSRKSESRFAPCDLAVLLDQTLELAANDYDLKKKYDFRKIELIRDYEEGVPRVACEATKLQQVFFNIVKNAAQAMWEAACSSQRLHLQIAREGERVRVRIRDTGPGMNDAIRKRIFEPFYTTKEPGVGTGLGLSVAYFIITENHRGSLTVDSTPGRGTTFTIRLPFMPPKP